MSVSVLPALFFPICTFFILLCGFIWGAAFMYKLSSLSASISFLYALVLVLFMGFFPYAHLQSAQISLMPSFTYGLRIGLDGVSIFFIVLTNLFNYLCTLNLTPTSVRLHYMLFCLIFLQFSVLCTFMFLDILGFFIFFESTLIPIYYLVLLWGSRERRVRASYMISIYTLLGSIFSFFNLLYLYSKMGTTDYQLLLHLVLTDADQNFLWITFFIAFAAKIPLFPLHIWLPEAHVEAPTIGSVLLAVLLLKLGTYGLVRFTLPLFPKGTVFFSSSVSTFALLGMMYTSIIAVCQLDLKKIIAYSSVGHSNLVLLGFMTDASEAMQGALFQSLSHGMVSGALFFCVGSLYERYTMRSLKYFGGLAYCYPVFTLIFLLFSLANISFPLTSSFVGEFYIFVGLFRQNFWATIFAATSSVLGAVYTLWTFNRIFFGQFRRLKAPIAYIDLSRKEIMLFSAPIIALFISGLAPHLFMDVFFKECMNLQEQSKMVCNN